MTKIKPEEVRIYTESLADKIKAGVISENSRIEDKGLINCVEYANIIELSRDKPVVTYGHLQRTAVRAGANVIAGARIQPIAQNQKTIYFVLYGDGYLVKESK